MAKRKPKIKTRLQGFLKNGFWFPFFQKIIDWIYNYLSVSKHFNQWLKKDDNAVKGVSELYQFVFLIIGTLWLLFIYRSSNSILTSPFFRLVGIGIAIYIVSELFIFSLHWTFVAEKELESIKRSLAMFILNLFEIAIYFSIIYTLNSCYLIHSTPWSMFYKNVVSIFNLDLSSVKSTPYCVFYSHYQVIISTTLMVIIIASLVGAVVRKEKD